MAAPAWNQRIDHENEEFSSLTKRKRDDHDEGATAARRIGYHRNNGKIVIPLFDRTQSDRRAQRSRLADEMKSKCANSGMDGHEHNRHENIDFGHDNTTTTAGDGELQSKSKSQRPLLYASQIMRIRSHRLPESIGRQCDETQGFSTSFECISAQAAGKDERSMAEHNIQEASRVEALLPRPVPDLPAEMNRYTAFRLPQNPPLSSTARRSRSWDAKSTKSYPETSPWLPRLPIQTGKTLSRSSDVPLACSHSSSSAASQEVTTKDQSLKKSARGFYGDAIDWIFKPFKSSQSILPTKEPTSREKLSEPTQLSGTNAADRDSASSPSSEDSSQTREHGDEHEMQPIRLIYLCINPNTPCFVTINCVQLTNDYKFFGKLKSAYDHKRGYWRRWFSIKQYSHCEFYLFGKWAVDLGGPLAKHEFPKDDPSYEVFTPRPPFQALHDGPIPPQEFRDRYYRSAKKHWGSPSAPSSSTSAPAVAALDRTLKSMPVRTKALDWKDGQIETFYGLLAVERLCFLRVGVYLVVLVALGVTLGVLWAHQWGGMGLEHLHNALMPLLLALTAWQIVAAW